MSISNVRTNGTQWNYVDILVKYLSDYIFWIYSGHRIVVFQVSFSSLISELIYGCFLFYFQNLTLF